MSMRLATRRCRGPVAADKSVSASPILGRVGDDLRCRHDRRVHAVAPGGLAFSRRDRTAGLDAVDLAEHIDGRCGFVTPADGFAGGAQYIQ
jgi:hypothetical protein